MFFIRTIGRFQIFAYNNIFAKIINFVSPAMSVEWNDELYYGKKNTAKVGSE